MANEQGTKQGKGTQATKQWTQATRSSFGVQVLSKRASSPAARFGSGLRSTKLHDPATESARLGTASPGPTSASVGSSLGPQVASRCQSAPAFRIPRASQGACSVSGPGPADYSVPTDTMGVQSLDSCRPNSAAFKLGRGSRWSEFKPGLTGEPVQPMLLAAAPGRGCGSGPAWSFLGPRERRPLTAGCSGCPLAPTSSTTPGPGSHHTECGFWRTQVDARSAPGVTLPRATRDALLPAARSSMGPACPQISSLGRQVASRSRSAPGLKFGSSERFSDLKPRAAAAAGTQRSSGQHSSLSSKQSTPRRSKPAGLSTCWSDGPGPGEYIV